MPTLKQDIKWWITKEPLAVAGMGILLVICFLAIFVPFLPIHNPQTTDMSRKLSPPSWDHPMGTDDLGRDILSRVVYGARTSLLVGAAVVSSSFVIGTLLGLIAGYLGGFADEIIMRITDIFLAFPGLILAMAFAVVLGPGIFPAIVALSLVWWPWYARLARSVVLSCKQTDFVEAARALGSSTFRILRAHLLPNSLHPLIIQATLDMGYAILTTSSLSFIGLGVQEPIPEWGAMLNIARRYLLTAWWFITFPGLAIFITVLAVNLAGDGLRDYLNPRVRKGGIRF